MRFNTQWILFCLSCQISRNLHKVQSTLIQESKPCALDHEVHFENVHSPGPDGRRQDNQEAHPILGFLLPNKGPKKSPKYNPTLGYEPYWPLGEWVFSTAPNKTTKGVSNEICGQKCPDMFKRYGRICARNKNAQYKTFENYCDLVSADCLLRIDWLIIYRGHCLGDFKTYPTTENLIESRAAEYISNFIAARSTTELVIDSNLLDNLRPTTKKYKFI